MASCVCERERERERESVFFVKERAREGGDFLETERARTTSMTKEGEREIARAEEKVESLCLLLHSRLSRSL